MLRIETQDYLVAGVLDNAAALLAKGWTRGHLARRADGICWLPEMPEATAWCAAGAIQRVVRLAGPQGLEGLSPAQVAAGAHAATYSVTRTDLTRWNDCLALGAEHVRGMFLDVARRLRKGDAELSSAVALAIRTGQTGEEADDAELPF